MPRDHVTAGEARIIGEETAFNSNETSSTHSGEKAEQQGSENPTKRKAKCKLMQIRDDKSTSDVVLLIGKDRTPFYLHKPILSIASDFLRAILVTASRSGDHPIPMPMITPEAFEVITRWMYGGGLLLEPEYGPSVLDVVSGTKYLHLDDMRMKILDHVEGVMERILSQPVISRTTEEGKRVTNEMNDVIRFFVQLCNICWEDDLDKLVKCADWIIRGQDVDVGVLVPALGKQVGGRLFIAAIIQAGKNNGCIACDVAQQSQGVQATLDRIVSGAKSHRV
ncbi:hypothetical protein TWF506_004376 [Arthrobotrys conoides]|uniref:BTB domain-containing protein n=1 Tax=Arthrobotrys conoides TaxID=74498 RepID=A0AAN8MWV7_9PEZI